MSGRASYERWVRVWRLLDRGWPLRAIARAEPCHVETIRHYVRKGRPPVLREPRKPDIRPTPEEARRRSNVGQVKPPEPRKPGIRPTADVIELRPR